MISLDKYKRILDSGLLLDHYLVLCTLRDGKPLPKSRRIDGFINLLNKKGYIEDGALTDKAFDIIDISTAVIVDEETVDTPKFDFGKWATDLHSKCKKKVMELTGKEQVMSKIKPTDKKGFRFLEGERDFMERLFKCIQKYKLKNMDIIEAAILNHIDDCHKKNNWFPLMKYYISKQGEGSPLVSDIENGFQATEAGKNTQKFV